MLAGDSLVDTTVKGLENYSVHEHLGAGAKSDVFRVTDKRNGRTYVLKQMSLKNMDEEEQFRAKKEILVMNGVNHPNVVKFRESFASDTAVDIVMECCECGTLEQLIERQRYEGKPFPGELLIEWMAELLCGLAHIHSRRIVHRDIKSSNIFVTAKNHLKLGDFGVSVVLSNANARARDMIGTPLYFSPEVCEGLTYDERSDVWSLGIVFYEMCTLRRPFEANHFLTLIQKILSDDVAPFNTGLDSSFEEIVHKMLSKNPRDRPTAQVLIEEFLELPTSHPSHPSQKPSKGRVVQQYYGPELTYEKEWPPPPHLYDDDDNDNDNDKDSLLASWDIQSTASSENSFSRVEVQAQPSPAQHNIGAAATDVRSGPSTTPRASGEAVSQQQVMDPSPGRTSLTPRKAAKPRRGEVVQNCDRGTSVKNISSVVKATTPRKSEGSKKKIGADVAAAAAPLGSKAGPVRKTSGVKKKAASSSATGATSSSSSLRKIGSPRPTVSAKASRDDRKSEPKDGSPCGNSSIDLREVKEDLLKTRNKIFGDGGVAFSDDAPVIISGGDEISSLGVSISSLTFLDDVKVAMNKHSLNGNNIPLWQLDAVVSLLNQYKSTYYGQC